MSDHVHSGVLHTSVMEKFAVDLDRVLDEFEYNEDCAEQTSGCGKETCHSLSSDMINLYAQDEIPVKTNVNLSEVADSEETSGNSVPIEIIQMDSSFQSSKFDDGDSPYEMKIKEFIESNSRQCSSKVRNMTTSNSKKDESNISLHCKLNVSGVFSCLNEYINTGNVSLHMGQADDSPEEENKYKDLLVEEKCEISDCVISQHEPPYWESGSDTSCGEKSFISIQNFHQQSHLQYASSADSEESFTSLKILLDDVESKLADGEAGQRMDSVVSIQCQERNRKLVLETVPSREVAVSNLYEETMEVNPSEEMETCYTSTSDNLCSSAVKQCIMDDMNESANTVTGDSSCGLSSESKCTTWSILSEDARSNPHTSDMEPDIGVNYASNADVNNVTGEIDAVGYSAESSAVKEDEVVSSPDSSETSSVEVTIQQFQSSSMSNTDNEIRCTSEEQNKLGIIPPVWVPDEEAPSCMLCFCRFTVLKRRHHCRACGKVFCSKCCCLKYRLNYLNNSEVRVCQLCHDTLVREAEGQCPPKTLFEPSSTDFNSRSADGGRQPNPNNPMEYCSTIPPLEQAASVLSQPVPSVLVPVGVLKREGCTRLKSDVAKQVMFSDGIRPGGDLTELDASPEQQIIRQSEESSKRMGNLAGTSYTASRPSRSFDPKTSFISTNGIPPLAVIEKGKLKLEDIPFRDMPEFLFELRCETKAPAVFSLNQNLFVRLKILNLDCCVNRTCWCFSTMGMSCVGQDEIVIILECLPSDTGVPKDIFHFLNTLYHDASQGILVSEMSHTAFKTSVFLGSEEHGGFLYIRPSFQCLHKLILPPAPYLVGILIHRWEIPWAKLFPIRLMLRLGAEFRYYPCTLVSVQQREPVYCEIGHTIMNLLADFRNMSYTLPSVRGMVIHMEDRHTSILLPKNRYDQVARALSNSNDHVLALAANFSLDADSHLVCIQSPTDDSYHTQAINIHNKPRKVTGASFVVFNGALKISSNLMAKSTIVEDGLMVQITPDTIQQLRSSLHKMKDFVIHCGPTTASAPDEIVDIRWVEDDHNFNIGVQSVIDGMALDGVPSIRVHNGSDFLGKTRFIRWTEVFVLQPGSISDGVMGANDAVDVSRVAENLATAACMALCDFLDLLAQGEFTRIGVRANIHQDNVGYAVGSRGEKLPPIYMKTLDSTLVPVLHHTATIISNSSPVVLELLFHIMLR